MAPITRLNSAITVTAYGLFRAVRIIHMDSCASRRQSPDRAESSIPWTDAPSGVPIPCETVFPAYSIKPTPAGDIRRQAGLGRTRFPARSDRRYRLSSFFHQFRDRPPTSAPFSDDPAEERRLSTPLSAATPDGKTHPLRAFAAAGRQSV